MKQTHAYQNPQASVKIVDSCNVHRRLTMYTGLHKIKTVLHILKMFQNVVLIQFRGQVKWCEAKIVQHSSIRTTCIYKTNRILRKPDYMNKKTLNNRSRNDQHVNYIQKLIFHCYVQSGVPILVLTVQICNH